MKNRTLREKIDEIQMVQRKAWLAGEGTTEAELATERLALSLAHWPGATGRPACGAPITARLAQGVVELQEVTFSGQRSTGLIDDMRIAVIPSRHHGADAGGCAPAG